MARKNLNKTTQSTLPLDIIETILFRLPVKSLLRFKSVCKSWNTMISDPRFVQIHHYQSMDSDSQNLFLLDGDKGFSLVKFKGRKFQTKAQLENPRGAQYLLCIGDSVVLLQCSYQGNRTYVLWNPCTQQHTTFRFPYKINDIHHTTYGLCHDLTNNDFKIVITSENFYAVFSCKNRSWTPKKEFYYHTPAYPGIDDGVSADGAVYWGWYDEVEWISKLLLCFDPKDDKFKIVSKPENVADNIEFVLCCLKGYLCLFSHGRNGTPSQLWIKEKGGPDRNSWNVLMNIENFPKKFRWPIVLLPYIENKVIINLGNNRFRICDLSEKTYEDFCVSGAYNMDLFSCLDSMFFPIMKTRPKRKRSDYS